MRLFLYILNGNTTQSKRKIMRKTNERLVSYLNRAMRTLRRSILAMATKIIARIKAIVEYVSVPSTNTLKEMKL